VPGSPKLSVKTLTARRPALVASGHHTFRAAGRATITLTLTAAGRRLLAHAHRQTLTAKATFTPRGGKAVVVKRTIVLR
jgi:hypothetical protein